MTPALPLSTPQLLEQAAANLPDKWRELPIYITFRVYRKDNGRIGKEPLIAGTNRHASSTDPRTWRPLDVTLADCRRRGLFLGLSLPDGHTLVDEDGVIGPDGTIAPATLSRIRRLNSVSVRTISGIGTHTYIAGLPPENATKPAGVELYPEKRLVLWTGDIIEHYNTITERSDVLARLFPPTQVAPLPDTFLTLNDDELLARAFGAANGAELERLLAGDLNGYGNDHSAADLAAASKLSFYTQNGPQIIRIIGASPLGRRDKWQKRPDYQERTVARALQRSTFYTPPAPKIDAITPNLQDAATDDPIDECADVRDELARLRAKNAALSRQLTERDQHVAALKERAERAESRLNEVSLLQSATMAMLRSRQLRPGEKVIGLVALFEEEAARQRGAIDAEHWVDAPLDRYAEAGGCSADTAGRNLNTIASTGIIETRTVTRRNPASGEIRKHRQVRLTPVPDQEPPPSLPERIIALSTAEPVRDPEEKGWGGKRVCEVCGDVGTVTITTIACAGCGQILSTSEPTYTPGSPSSEDPASPKPHLAPSKNRGSYVVPMPQVAASGQEQRRERAAADLELREPTWLRDAPDPWDSPPQPPLFVVPDPPQVSSHWAGD